ncbi:hypothetical protein BST61_g9757 [Cercospora zeina]
MGAKLGAKPRHLSLKTIKDAIPAKCFQPSVARTCAHIVLDLVLCGSLVYGVFALTAQVQDWWLRSLIWAGYGYLQGLVCTGIWILAHECGHGALFTSNWANDSVGFVLHTALGVPYFSWKFAHARHHRYTNHMEKDTAFVPSRASDPTISEKIAAMLHLAEDAPLFTAVTLILHQLLGWQAYVLTYASGGSKSTPRAPENRVGDTNLLNPSACIWTPAQRFFVGLSTFGLAAVVFGLSVLADFTSWSTVFLLYGVPYLWLNHWLVAITFLHHTHPDVPHFEDSTWTYTKGALSTIDREFGFIGRYIFHGIIEHHVVHHLFTTIPFYHAGEATKAIQGVLGDSYHRDETPFLLALWRTFQRCRKVEASKSVPGEVHWKPARVSVRDS